MIKVIYKNGSFLIKGSFNFGIVGIYENKSFSNNKIEIINDIDEIIYGLNNNSSSYYKTLNYYIKNKNINKNTIINALEHYYNKRKKDIEKNIKQINDYFLLVAIDSLIGTKYPFWEIDEIIIKEEIGKYNKENLEKEIYNENINEFYKIFEEYNITELNLKKLNNINIQEKFEKIFPMFNLEKYLKCIIPQKIVIDENIINISFSDNLDKLGLCFCLALFSIYEDLTIKYIDNF